MLLPLLSLAKAGDLCRWPKADHPKTTAERDEVTVNGMAFEVATDAGHARFVAVLRVCGAEAAIDEFEAWRKSRDALARAQVAAALGGYAALQGLQAAERLERTASVHLRNELWYVLTGGAAEEEEEPVVAPAPPPKPTDPDLPTVESFRSDEDE